MGEKKPSYNQLLKEIERLRRCLTYDSITGLYRTQEERRQRILETIGDIHRKAKKIGFLSLDFNNLKAWNKEFGHEENVKLQTPDKNRLDCRFNLGFDYEEENEIQEELKNFGLKKIK